MKNSNPFFATLAGILSSGLVLLGMVTCCGMPLLAGILAAVGVGASQLSFLAKYQGMFMGIAIASLMFGFYQAYFAKKASCCGGATEEPQGCCCCASDATASTVPKPSRFLQYQKIFLWIGAAVVGAVLVFSGNSSTTNNTDADSSCCPDSSPTSCCPAGNEQIPIYQMTTIGETPTSNSTETNDTEQK
ncbi:MAG: hypothetical protein ACRC46_14195 [Thermoguttaceae bacterium]